MNWRLAPTIGLVALLAPAMAHAQTNLDQGKSASQIFAAACVECHKAPRGLAKGKNSAALTDFLVEHYTTSRAQAAALAAYVLGGRGAEPIGGAAQGKAQKPPAERADRGAPAQEEAKPSKHQARPSKPEEGARSEAKSDAKPEVKPEIEPLPGERPPTTATRGRHREPKIHQIPYRAGRGCSPACRGRGRAGARSAAACGSESSRRHQRRKLRRREMRRQARARQCRATTSPTKNG